MVQIPLCPVGRLVWPVDGTLGLGLPISSFPAFDVVPFPTLQWQRYEWPLCSCDPLSAHGPLGGERPSSRSADRLRDQVFGGY